MHSTDAQRSNRPLRIIAAISVLALIYLGRDILIPIALAVLLTFLLDPVVRRLCRWKIPHPLAVALTVLLTFAVIGAIGVLVSRQVSYLTQNAPQYRDEFDRKINALSRFTTTINNIDTEMSATRPTSVPKVEVVNDGPGAYTILSYLAVPILVPVADGAVVLLLVIFFLLNFANISERLIWVAGTRQMSLTTAALDEAAQRIGGYLRMQALVNLIYGTAIAIALTLLGIPGALFWGVLAGALRFVPFLGPWIAGILPSLLAFAAFQGWHHMMGVVGIFAFVEICVNLIEPWVYGRSSGLSSLGVVCAVVFWAWMWGPVGMLLAVPVTACLLILGKYIPELSALNYLFGEAFEIPKPVRLYQRLLVGDDPQAKNVIENELHSTNFTDTCQTLLVPVLQEIKRDVRLRRIDAAQASRALSIIDLATAPATAPAEADHPAILFVPVRDRVDDTAALLLVRAAAAEAIVAHCLSSRALTSEILDRAEKSEVKVICLVQIWPLSRIHGRHLAKRLATRLPEVTIFAANIKPGESEKHLQSPIARPPVREVFLNVNQLIERLRESRVVTAEPQAQPV